MFRGGLDQQRSCGEKHSHGRRHRRTEAEQLILLCFLLEPGAASGAGTVGLVGGDSGRQRACLARRNTEGISTLVHCFGDPRSFIIWAGQLIGIVGEASRCREPWGKQGGKRPARHQVPGVITFQ